MKVKLLKKVRERFTIEHLPNGIIIDNYHYKYNLYRLTDANKLSYWDKYVQLGNGVKSNICKDIFKTEKECIYYLTDCIIAKLKEEGYKNRKQRMCNMNVKKVWYV